MIELRRIANKWFWVGALLAVTLWFPSTREAQKLCLRWLLHLNGNTFVEGSPSGANDPFGWLIPNVQFTHAYQEKLLSNSTNSLDDYARATACDDDLTNFPPEKSNWTNNPFLPWAVFQMTWISIERSSTNLISLATFDRVLPIVKMAESTWPTNGAFLQAEATIEFFQLADRQCGHNPDFCVVDSKLLASRGDRPRIECVFVSSAIAV